MKDVVGNEAGEGICIDTASGKRLPCYWKDLSSIFFIKGLRRNEGMCQCHPKNHAMMVGRRCILKHGVKEDQGDYMLYRYIYIYL